MRYLLYGSARRSGGRLRIGTELSDVETDIIIGSDKYDGCLTDLFEFQGRVANPDNLVGPGKLDRYDAAVLDLVAA